jgi:hypothetical protein
VTKKRGDRFPRLVPLNDHLLHRHGRYEQHVAAAQQHRHQPCQQPVAMVVDQWDRGADGDWISLYCPLPVVIPDPGDDLLLSDLSKVQDQSKGDNHAGHE